MDEKKYLKRIEINNQIMHGKPVIKGTRLPVDIIVEKILIGHPSAWNMAYKNVHNRENFRTYIRYMEETNKKYGLHANWYNRITTISMLSLLFAPDVQRLKLNVTQESKPRPVYVS